MMIARLLSLVGTVSVFGVVTVSFPAGESRAAQVSTLTVSQRGDDYSITLDAVVDAPAPAVYKMLADYGHLDRLSPVIAEVSVKAAPDGQGERVRSVLKGCVMFVCRMITQVEDVIEPDEHTIVGDMVPGQSDFKRGHCIWRVTEEGSRTRLHYEATRTAAFWVPPLIGPWAIKHAMREHLNSSVAALERLVNQNAEQRD